MPGSELSDYGCEIASRIRDSLWSIAKHEVKMCGDNRDRLRQVFEAVWETRNHGFCCDHIVTEDGNTNDSCVNFCITNAEVARHYDCMLMLMVLRAIDDENLRDSVVSNETSR